ncbi:MAG: hypothetical protein JOY68_06355 [Candidatus Dormibacteraeota bacterium]|nr:hypothetical protein [Candidatus Dormibacteraeota bacterium]
MFTVDGFVEECRAALDEAAPTLAVKEFVGRAVADRREVTRELGEPARGQLRVLYSSAELTIVHAVWAPCMSLYPHDHRMWAVIGIYGGAEDNVFFRRVPGGIADAGGRTLRDRDVAVLGPEAIHSVTNPERAFTGAIHVYGGDFLGVERSEWDARTLKERPYDFERVRGVFEAANERAPQLLGTTA